MEAQNCKITSSLKPAIWYLLNTAIWCNIWTLREKLSLDAFVQSSPSSMKYVHLILPLPNVSRKKRFQPFFRNRFLVRNLNPLALFHQVSACTAILKTRDCKDLPKIANTNNHSTPFFHNTFGNPNAKKRYKTRTGNLRWQSTYYLRTFWFSKPRNFITKHLCNQHQKQIRLLLLAKLYPCAKKIKTYSEGITRAFEAVLSLSLPFFVSWFFH